MVYLYDARLPARGSELDGLPVRDTPLTSTSRCRRTIPRYPSTLQKKEEKKKLQFCTTVPLHRHREPFTLRGHRSKRSRQVQKKKKKKKEEKEKMSSLALW